MRDGVFGVFGVGEREHLGGHLEERDDGVARGQGIGGAHAGGRQRHAELGEERSRTRWLVANEARRAVRSSPRVSSSSSAARSALTSMLPRHDQRHERRPASRPGLHGAGARSRPLRRVANAVACALRGRRTAEPPMSRNGTAGSPGTAPSQHEDAGDPQRLRHAEESAWRAPAERRVGLLARDARDEDAGGGRQDQRRDLRDEPVADGEQAVALERARRSHALAGRRRWRGRRGC